MALLKTLVTQKQLFALRYLLFNGSCLLNELVAMVMKASKSFYCICDSFFKFLLDNVYRVSIRNHFRSLTQSV